MNIVAASERLNHLAAHRMKGDAAYRVLPKSGFDDAIAEVTSWPGYQPTPLHTLDHLAQSLGVGAVRYKDEGPRFGLGSFKALGGAYAGMRILQRELSRMLDRNVELREIRDGELTREAARIILVSATDGNHGRSLAWGAKMFGAGCRIYVHRDVSEGRTTAMRDLGATVITVDGDYDDSVRAARDDADANGWFVVSDTSWEGYVDPPRDVMSGYGVMTREITEDLQSPPSHVFLQGGVGGMAASVVAFLRQTWGADNPRIIIVEPELAPCLFESAQNGRATAVGIDQETIMAGLSCGVPSDLAWEILSQEVDDFITIPDTMVAPAMRLLAQPGGGDPVIEAGESAVAGLAALIVVANDTDMREILAINKNSEILLIGSEGITDSEIYDRIMAGANK